MRFLLSCHEGMGWSRAAERRRARAFRIFTGWFWGLCMVVGFGSSSHGEALKPLPLSPAESIRLVGPLLDAGDVIWLECDGAGQFQQASVLARIPASASKAYEIVSDPLQYKAMSPSVDSVSIREKSAEKVTFESTVRIPFGAIHNVIAMELKGPDRIETRFVDGDLKTGDFRWWFVPESETRSAVIYTLKTDVRETNWMVRQLTRIRPETQHGGNSGTGLITVWGLKRVLMGAQSTLLKHQPSPWAKQPVELPLKLSVASGLPRPDWSALTPLLQRGPLIQVESAPGGRLKRVTVYGLTRATPKSLYDLVGTPEAYPRHISHFQSVEVTKRVPGLIEFESTVEFMKLRYRSRERMELFPDRILSRTIEGDLAGAASQLELLPMAEGATLAAWSFYMDPSSNGWIMKQVFGLDPLVEHIFAVSGGFGTLVGLMRAAEQKPPLFSEEKE